MNAVAIMPGADPQTENMLVTMSLVDEMRHREAQLAELADDSSRLDELKAKLRRIYHSEGIVVTDAQIEQAIAARRQQKFVYFAPKGIPAVMAVLWIRRASLLVGAGLVLALLGVSYGGYEGLIAHPAERRAVAHVNQINEGLKQLPDAVSKLKGQIENSSLRLKEESEAAQSAEHPERIAPAVDHLVATGERAQSRAWMLLQPLQATRVDPVNVETVDARAPAAESFLKGATETLQKVADQVQVQVKAANDIRAMRTANVGLDTANVAVLSRNPQGETEAERRTVFARGEAAVQDGNVGEARTAITRLQEISVDLEFLAELKARGEQTYALAIQTGVEGKDRETVEGAYRNLVDHLRPGEIRIAESALSDLTTMSAVLQADYQIQVRSQSPSAVKRKEKDAASKQSYAIVEAIDGQGRVVELPVLDEITGKKARAKVFGVRVADSVFDDISHDKNDNGVLDHREAGYKARGKLTPEFSIPVTGGYILDW